MKYLTRSLYKALDNIPLLQIPHANSAIYVSSRPIPTFSLKWIVKVIQRSPPLLPWLMLPAQAAPPALHHLHLCRSVPPPCPCGCPWSWALVAFWAALSCLWKFSTAIDVAKTNQGKKWKRKEWNSDSDRDFTVWICIWQDVVILQYELV